MAFKKIPLTIDTMIRNPVPVEGINQEDNTELNIVVTENKTPKDLSNQTIKVYIRRIDGTLVEQTDQITPTNASKGEVTVKLKNSAFNKEGYALFQLDVSDSSGRITSSYATFKIGKGLVSGEAIANTNEIEALKKIEEYIKKANQELETFKQTVAEINENEATRQENEVVRVKGEASRNEAEKLRVVAETGRVAAEIKREEGFNKFEGRISANTEELKNARTATTGEEFNSLDERIDCEVDRLNKKIDVTMFQQEDKENHVIENTVDGMTTDMVVKGRTLQNLWKPISIQWEPTNKWFNALASSINFSITGKVITVKNTTDKAINFQFSKLDNNYDSQIVISSGETKVINVTSAQKFRGVIGLESLGWKNTEEDKDKLKNGLIVCIGEYSYLPDLYFEGIKSFGQQEEKISILSSGKNLLNPSLGKPSHGGITITRKNDTITLSGNASSLNNWSALEIPVYMTKGTWYFKYKAEGNGFLRANFIDAQTKVSISGDITLPLGKVINNDKDRNVLVKIFLKGDTGTGEITNKYWDMQLEEGTKATPYEPYKCDKKDISLSEYGFDEGLRGLNSSVCDELNDIEDVTIKRIEKIVINDINISEIQDRPNAQNTNWFQTDYISNTTIKAGGLNINNKLIGVTEGQAWADSNDFECLSITGTSSGARIKGRVNKGVTSEQLKERLKGLIVYYELKEPVETPLSENINLKTFGEKTYVGFENSISGTSSFKAPVNTVATITRLNRENRALEEENRSLRQDFESTTLSLTDSDLELVKQNVDVDFRLMEVEFALDIPQAILRSNINFKKKGEVKSMARTPYEMMKIVILSGDYDREDYMHKVGKYYERGRMSKEEHDELMSLMTADEVIGG